MPSVAHIILSKNVLLLLLIATVIAAPMSWWVIDGWLTAFTYRAPLNLPSLVAILVGSLLSVVIVTMFQSLTIATTNTGHSLKYE